jgi:hypothetical protein
MDKELAEVLERFPKGEIPFTKVLKAMVDSYDWLIRESHFLLNTYGVTSDEYNKRLQQLNEVYATLFEEDS